MNGKNYPIFQRESFRISNFYKEKNLTIFEVFICLREPQTDNVECHRELPTKMENPSEFQTLKGLFDILN